MIYYCRCHLIDCCNTYAGPRVADPYDFSLSYWEIDAKLRWFVWKEGRKYVHSVG